MYHHRLVLFVPKADIHFADPQSADMSSLSRIWKDKCLTTATEVRLYQALVMSVLLYVAETWTLLAADLRSLEAFHMRCQRQILGICCTDHISNATISSHTGLTSVGEQITSCHVTILGHVARLGDEVPAHQAVRVHVDLSLGHLSGRDWKLHPGRPNNRWVDQIHNDTGNMPSTLWRSAILCGHGTGVTHGPRRLRSDNDDDESVEAECIWKTTTPNVCTSLTLYRTTVKHGGKVQSIKSWCFKNQEISEGTGNGQHSLEYWVFNSVNFECALDQRFVGDIQCWNMNRTISVCQTNVLF